MEEAVLRLRLLPGEGENLLADPHLRGSPVSHQQLLSVYYDTEDLSLWQHNYALCTRRDGGSWVQILSGEDGLKRFATVHETEGKEVDRSKLPVHGRLGSQLGKILAKQPLQPVFQVELRHSRWQCTLPGGAQAAVSVDSGEIRAAGRLEPVHELRLDLTEGTVADLYAWVLSLAEQHPLIWETSDEVSRGYGLLLATPVTHAKAKAIQLAEGCDSEAAWVAIVAACLAQLQANLAATQAGQIEGLHQMRVALRRLRSCLRLFRPLIPTEASAALVDELRWLNGYLGPARDWDVFLEEGLAPVFAHFPDRRGLNDFRRRAEALRQSHRQALCQCLAEPRYHRLILRLHAWLAGQTWRQHLAETQRKNLDRPVIEFATAVLSRHHRRVVKVGKVFSTLSLEERHALRIRIKRLRYALEFFASLYHGAKVEAYVKAAASLQDDLGGLNDAVVAGRLLDEARLGKATPTRHLIEGWYACHVYHHEQRFTEDWEQFMDCKPPWK